MNVAVASLDKVVVREVLGGDVLVHEHIELLRRCVEGMGITKGFTHETTAFACIQRRSASGEPMSAPLPPGNAKGGCMEGQRAPVQKKSAELKLH